MIVTKYSCDHCGEVLTSQENFLAFSVDDTRNFFGISICNLTDIRPLKKVLDLTGCTFCSKECMLNYIDECLEDTE